MRKNFGPKTWIYPMPVLIVGTYDENGNPNAMNAAWGGIYDTNQVMVCLAHEHKTTENILKRKAFTVSMATADYVKECDYVGLVSGNNEKNKLEKCGLNTFKSEFVNAPIIKELPFTLECIVKSYDANSCCLVGEIINISADETVLTNGKVDVSKLCPITYDSFSHQYYVLGSPVGNAFSDGKIFI
jgi:flavin reductase (DIM6/NTAB) family NADH-FMN oxidoreductase RutF